MTILRTATMLAMTMLLGAAAPGAGPVAHREGLNLNSFVQRGPVAAHIVLRSGRDPRLLVAFPAGNSGIGLWFDRVSQDATWSMTTPARPLSATDARGRPLHGIIFEASIRSPWLVVKQAILSSVRVLRDYQALATVPTEVLAAPRVADHRIAWSRDRLDGAAGYRLSIASRTARSTAMRSSPAMTDRSACR